MRRLTIAIGCLILSACASAQEVDQSFAPLAEQAAPAKEPVYKWGLGVRSCTQFAQDYKSNPELWETLYYVWAEGYMTGFEMARSSFLKEDTDLNPYNRDEKWRRESLRYYCSDHPLAPYSEAVANLVLELMQPPK